MVILLIAKSAVYTHFNQHSHDSWEMIINLSGKGREVIGDQWHSFEPGTITFCPPHTMHNKFLDEDSGCWQDIYTHFSDPMKQFPMKPMWLIDDSTCTFRNMAEILLSLYYEKGKDSPLVSSFTNALCDMLLERIHQQTPFAGITEKLNYGIIRNFTNPEWDIGQYLSKTDYAIDYVRRVYRADMHTTPQRYLMHVRIEHAKQMLKVSSPRQSSIEEIAMASGFDDANYFSRAFKKETGLTPSQYRKQHYI